MITDFAGSSFGSPHGGININSSWISMVTIWALSVMVLPVSMLVFWR